MPRSRGPEGCRSPYSAVSPSSPEPRQPVICPSAGLMTHTGAPGTQPPCAQSPASQSGLAASTPVPRGGVKHHHTRQTLSKIELGFSHILVPRALSELWVFYWNVTSHVLCKTGKKETHWTSGRPPNPCRPPASLTSPGAALPHWPREDGAQDPAGPALGASGDLCCRGVGPDAGEGESRGRAWAGPLGPAAGTSLGDHKAPFSSGTRRCGEPPSGRGTRLPHSRPYQWRAVHDVGSIVLVCGPIQAEEGEGVCFPQEKGHLEPREDTQ